MKRTLALAVLVIAGLVAGTFPALAQSNALNNLSSTYGNWMAQSSSTVAGSSTAGTVVLNNCFVNVGPIGGGHPFFPFATNVPVTIQDGSNTETVTPSAVQTPIAATEPASASPYFCSFTATFANAHSFGPTTSIGSGDSGVAEAANDNGGGYPLTKGTDQLVGTCTGTVTASQTNGLYGAGTATVACGSTTITLGKQMGRSFVAKGLSCTSSAGGVGSGSGVVTALKNHQGTNSTQTVTCTFGTGTSCNDGTHTFAGVAGDILGLQVTSASGETLANVACTLNLY